jgi:acetolactate synthase small subunit
MKKETNYKAIVKVQNGIGVIARMTIMLRKFNVNLQSIDVKKLDEGNDFYEIHMTLGTEKDDQGMYTVMKKLERLIPVIEVSYKKLND